LRVILLTLFFLSNLLSFKVASYNVENLFDTVEDGSEYKEYIPNNRHNWNKKTYKIKLKILQDFI